MCRARMCAKDRDASVDWSGASVTAVVENVPFRRPGDLGSLVGERGTVYVFL